MAVLPLLGLVAYDRLHTIPQLHQEVALRDAPRALAPIILRPPTRGALPAIEVRPEDRSVVLAIDLLATSADVRLQGQLRNGSGRAMFPPFSLTAPAPGEPLYVTVPTAALPAGAYELVIQIDATETRYPFTVDRR